MNLKRKRVLQGIIFVAIIVGFVLVGTHDFSKKVVASNEKFDSEYKNVNQDNVFVYANAQDVYSKMKSGNAIIFMGFPSNKWSGYYAELINTAAKETGIKEVLYYDFKEDRDNKNATYQSIVLRLTNYARMLDTGTQNIYAPTLVIIKNGEILAYDDEVAINQGNILPEVYWTDYKKGIKLNHFKTMFNNYLDDGDLKQK